jgi:cysteine desulfurase/selenocysteine lyase
LPLAQIFGLKASFEFLNNLEIEAINKNEKELKDHFLKIVRKLKEVIIYNQGSETTNIILFNLKDFHPHDVSEYLQKNNIYVRAGNFCCPYLDKAIKKESAIRISLAIYNTKKDINKLVKCLENLIKNPNLIVDIF